MHCFRLTPALPGGARRLRAVPGAESDAQRPGAACGAAGVRRLPASGRPALVDAGRRPRAGELPDGGRGRRASAMAKQDVLQLPVQGAPAARPAAPVRPPGVAAGRRRARSGCGRPDRDPELGARAWPLGGVGPSSPRRATAARRPRDPASARRFGRMMLKLQILQSTLARPRLAQGVSGDIEALTALPGEWR